MAEAAEKLEPKQCEQVLQTNINQMQYAHTVWAVTTRDALSVAELEDPRTWEMASSKLRLFDRVEIMSSNGSQLSLGIVTFVKGTSIKVQIYGHFPLHEQKRNKIEYEGFTVQWGGIDRNWIIVEDSSGNVMKENLPTDAAGIKYLEDHFKSLKIQR